MVSELAPGNFRTIRGAAFFPNSCRWRFLCHEILDGQFLHHLDLLKRGVLSEAEFSKANEVARSQSTALEARREELALWIEEQRTRVSTAERLPGAIQSFLADFESLDVRHQKAQLQAILKSAYVFRDDKIELEFRG